MEFKTLSSVYLTDHPYFTARRDSYQLPSGKIVDPYYIVELPPCAVALAITESGEALLVKQYRHTVGREMIELPGGFIDPNEAPDIAIRRELMEETGYEFSEYHYLGETAGNPGLLTNMTHMFLATGGKKVAAQSLDQNEEIALILKPVEEVKALLNENAFLQSMHAICIFYGLKKLDGLTSQQGL